MQKRHKIFIAINLPGDIKKHLARYQEKFPELPAKWTPSEDLRIILESLGGIYEHEFPQAIERAKEIAGGMQSFELHVNHIGYAPKDKLPPRMLWAYADKMHVTLAKISAFAWRQIEPEERPEVEEDVDLMFTVESIEVMESEMGKGGPHYTIIESIPLE